VRLERENENVKKYKKMPAILIMVITINHSQGNGQPQGLSLREQLVNVYRCRDRACPCPRLPEAENGFPYHSLTDYRNAFFVAIKMKLWYDFY